MSLSARRLVGALERLAAAAGCAVAIDHRGETPWRSVTFVGARHRLGVAGRDDAALAAWLAGLGEAEIAVPGGLVADCAVTPLPPDGCTERAASLEILLLDD